MVVVRGQSRLLQPVESFSHPGDGLTFLYRVQSTESAAILLRYFWQQYMLSMLGPRPRDANRPNMRQTPSRRRSTVPSPDKSTIDAAQQHNAAPDAMATLAHRPKSRLKPVSSDSLESVGFVSKGDNKYVTRATMTSRSSSLTSDQGCSTTRHRKTTTKR